MKLPRSFSWNRPLHAPTSENLPPEPDLPLPRARRRYLPWCGLAALLAVVAATGVAGRGDGKTDPSHVVAWQPDVDFQEKADAYILSFPADQHERGQIGLRRDGHALILAAQSLNGGAVQERRFEMPEAAPGARASVQQAGGRLVLTIPKAGAEAPALAGSSDPRQMMMAQFDRLRQQMDQMMAQAPSAGGAGLAGGDMVNVEEQADKYLIHLKVPKAQQDQVKVTVDDDRVLKITANQESGRAGFSQRSHFTQVLTLPGPVQSDKMSMSSGDQDMLITLPKA